MHFKFRNLYKRKSSFKFELSLLVECSVDIEDNTNPIKYLMLVLLIKDYILLSWSLS